jgi:hypothetical protein
MTAHVTIRMGVYLCCLVGRTVYLAVFCYPFAAVSGLYDLAPNLAGQIMHWLFNIFVGWYTIISVEKQ